MSEILNPLDRKPRKPAPLKRPGQSQLIPWRELGKLKNPMFKKQTMRRVIG